MRYQRHSFSVPMTYMVKMLLIALAVSYVFFALLFRTELGKAAFMGLVLEPEKVVGGFQVWRLVTYSMLHSVTDPFHVLFNGLLLYFLGPQLEWQWGQKYFLRFVILTALGGGIFVCIAYVLGLTSGSVLGFSAVCLGLLVAWGITYSTRTILLFFVIPLTGKQIVWIAVGLEVFYAVGANNISSAAHFGGMATAAILTLGLYRPERIRNLYRWAKWHLTNRDIHRRQGPYEVQ